MAIRTDFSFQHPTPKLANIQPWASHLPFSPQFPSLHRGRGARCLPNVSSRVIFTTFVLVFSTSSKNKKLQNETHQESCNMGTCQGDTRLCLGGTKLCLGTPGCVWGAPSCVWGHTKVCLRGTRLCLGSTRLCLGSIRLCLGDTKLCLGGRGWGRTRLCLVGVRRTAQMDGFHLNYRVKFTLYKVEIHLAQLWFVHLLFLKQI